MLAKPSGRTPHSLRAGHFESAQGHSEDRAAAASSSPLRGGKLLARAHFNVSYLNARELIDSCNSISREQINKKWKLQLAMDLDVATNDKFCN